MKINKTLIILQAIKARIKFKLGTNTNIDIFDKLKQNENFTFVFMPFDESIDGFSSRHKDHFIIIINSNKRKSRMNFTCAHELYHLLYEYNDKDEYIGTKETEHAADIFASYFLIPEEALYLYLDKHDLLNKKELNLKDIVNMEDYFQVSRAALLIRLRDAKIINTSEFDKFNKNISISRKKYGSTSSELSNINGKKYTIGEYNILAKRLLDEHKISLGKYQEYMIDAFNSSNALGISEDN